jgi:6-phosphogluconolactonase
MTSNLHIFDTSEETARAVSELILLKAKEKTKHSNPLNIALSGGNTPKMLFDLLVNEYEDKIPWHFIRLFWVDERCVPPTHPESNFGMTYESLLKNVPIPDNNIFRMIGEANPEKEAKRYQELLKIQLPSNKSVPQFDLILLGMGDDGHTASIFPNDLSLLYSDLFVETSNHPVTGQKRVTLTGTTINQAEEVVFLITGSSKYEVLEQIMNHKPGFKNYPASYIHSQNGAAQFYLDKAAAAKI